MCGIEKGIKMSTTIKIRNCNCIVDADIYLEENALNIKYGSNGTGKSTVCKAIFAKAHDDAGKLAELRPYGVEENDEEHQPNVTEIPYSNVRVFDETYVNSYLFQGTSFLENSYKVFLRSDKCEQLKEEINVLLAKLQNVFEENADIKKLYTFLPKYFDTIKFSDGKIQKRGGVGEFVKGNGGGFENYTEIKSYSPFYENRDMKTVAKWEKWRNDGINQMNGELCPFCTHQMESDKISKENEIISKVFKSSALSTASAVLEYLQEAVEAGYIDVSAVETMQEYIGNKSKEDALFSELQQLAIETNYLLTKINRIISFRPMNVTHEQLQTIENSLDEMIIESRQIMKFYTTDLINKLVETTYSNVEELKKNTGKLKGLFAQHEKKLEELIANRKEDINQFFTLAGFPYNFVIKGNGEDKAISYLVPTDMTEQDRVLKPEEHLSWGERNAFSLVMFMFQAISEKADLIVLDDPITSFDKDKKFAIIRRLFDNKKDSFKGKTVLMLTHEIQPVIDYIYGDFFKKYGLETSVNARLIRKEGGSVTEYQIEKEDLLNSVELAKKIAQNTTYNMAVRVVNLRKYVEMTDSNFSISPIYEVLSNIIHGRTEPTNKDGEALEDNVLETGCNALSAFLGNGIYEDIVNEVTKEKLMLLIDGDDTYSKIIAIRLLFERYDGLLTKLRRKYPAACKFVNETNHIENDYIFQLNPFKFFEIPDLYINELEDFISSQPEFA